jgi:hypothetical protein
MEQKMMRGSKALAEGASPSVPGTIISSAVVLITRPLPAALKRLGPEVMMN